MSREAIVTVQLSVECCQDLPSLNLCDSQTIQDKSTGKDVERLVPFLSSP